MTRALRPTPLFPLLLLLLLSSGLYGCRSLSSEISPSDDVSRTVMVNWDHDFHDDLAGNILTCGLPDGKLLAIARSRGIHYTLHAWSGLLMKLYEVPIATGPYEEKLALLHGADRTILLSQQVERDDAQVVLMRDLDVETGSLSEPREILRTDPNFDRQLYVRRSPDRRKVLLYGLSENLAGRRDRRKSIEYYAQYAAVLDIATGELWQSRDTIRYDSVGDGNTYRTTTLANDGTVGILEFFPTSDDRYDLVAHRIDESGSSLHRFTLPARLDSLDPDSDESDHMNPFHIAATFAADGSLMAATTLVHDELVRTLCVITLTPDFSRATFAHPVLYDEDIVKGFTDSLISRLSYTYGVGDIIAHDDGTLSILFDAVGFRTGYTSTSNSIFTTTSIIGGPVIIARFDPEKKSIDHRFIYRNERWKNGHLAMTEAGINRMSTGDSLFLVLRNRGSEAVNFYSVDFSRDSVERTSLAQLDDMAFYGSGMTVWHSPNELSLFAKRGDGGRDWIILRIRR